VANEYLAKIYLVTDAMRMNRTDGALVRVITPIGPNEDTAAARIARRHSLRSLRHASAVYSGLS
jgi:hypothetical protein